MTDYPGRTIRLQYADRLIARQHFGSSGRRRASVYVQRLRRGTRLWIIDARRVAVAEMVLDHKGVLQCQWVCC